ncbi:MAG TPA: SYNERG-CTERM sorting domain-containing protein, partial [Synergistaceae bacterium]|nr:SYNERG-CTERM sorting domain-containing protein [Synergistaceae bacterium]
GSGRGDSVLEAYDTAGNRVLRISETTLGGAVYDAVPLTAAAPTQAPSGGSGGGGCATGALPTPLALLLLAPALLLRRP